MKREILNADDLPFWDDAQRYAEQAERSARRGPYRAPEPTAAERADQAKASDLLVTEALRLMDRAGSDLTWVGDREVLPGSEKSIATSAIRRIEAAKAKLKIVQGRLDAQGEN